MGASGGGGSGQVSHSLYLELIHGDWLTKGVLPGDPVDNIETSITECMNNALGNSPWTGVNAYDPTNDIAAYVAEFALLKTILLGLDDVTDFETLYAASDAVLSDAVIAAEVDAYSDILDDEINTKVLPRYRRGMQDINAVVATSAYPLGLAVIEGFRTRDIAKFTAGLRNEGRKERLQATGMMIQMMTQRIMWRADYARTYADAMRLKFVAFKEQIDQDMDIDEKDGLWDLSVFQHGANLIAAIGGGTALPTGPKGSSKAASALGGAMSGAAVGTSINPGIGTVVGAVIGAAAGLLSN